MSTPLSYTHLLSTPGEEEEKEAMSASEKRAEILPSLSPEQEAAMTLFRRGENVFVSGPGGSGKSHLIRHMVFSVAYKDTIQVTSTTGCSSILLSNSIGLGPGYVKTIHSWSGIRLGKGDPAQIRANVLKNFFSVKAWKRVRCLIVDEVSMLSKKLFDLLDDLGRWIRKCDRPFGGIQVVFLGDMFQLPPIPDAGDEASGQFCFESTRWYTVFPREHHVALTRIYRQQDAQFQEILNQVRVGQLSKENADVLRRRIGRPYEGLGEGIVPIQILPTRAQVNAVNDREYAKIEEPEVVFDARMETECRTYLENDQLIPEEVWRAGMMLSSQAKAFEMGVLKSNSPVEDQLKFKKGVPVMCLVNLDLDQGIANGSLGVVVDFVFPSLAVVKFVNGVTRTIGHHGWQHSEYPNFVYFQVPLCLAYSSTIHKLQGSTLDLAEMNLGAHVFAEGQIYVGLSRVKSLEGLYLTAFHAHKIKVNPKALAFYTSSGWASPSSLTTS